jgi:hypothetical protein
LAEQAPVLHALAEVWRFTGKWQRAEDACRRALALAEAAGDQRGANDRQCWHDLRAAAIYRQRYASAPSAELRRRYRTLMGEDLPPPPPLCRSPKG